jgi:hypothetical protein
MRRHFLAIAVILTVAPACDNVAWGGIELTVESPGSPSGEPAVLPTTSTPDDVEPAPAPIGPLLLAGVREGAGVRLSPVGFLDGGVLTSLPSDGARADAALRALAVGSDWILFADGAEVGRVAAATADVDPALCGVDRVLTGTPEFLAAAASAQRFLALPAAFAGDWTSPRYAPLAHTYDQRVASLELGRTALPRVGAPWPTNGMLPVRRDIQAFRIPGDESPSFAASFVVRDTLDTSAPAAGAYALFLMANQDAGPFRQTFLWYRPANQGKAAPRYLGHLDWDRDGDEEVLLEVFGEGLRGYVALERGANGSWTTSYRSPCPHTSASTGR